MDKWFHIKLKETADTYLSNSIFWLGGNNKEDILKILKIKHKITENEVEWIREEIPPFV
jgi:hypothetical protein|tara:strand:- start:917 stop:1093 length:177 start_codon:yes stop_codon:yes gene_type:complete